MVTKKKSEVSFLGLPSLSSKQPFYYEKMFNVTLGAAYTILDNLPGRTFNLNYIHIQVFDGASATQITLDDGHLTTANQETISVGENNLGYNKSILIQSPVALKFNERIRIYTGSVPMDVKIVLIGTTEQK